MTRFDKWSWIFLSCLVVLIALAVEGSVLRGHELAKQQPAIVQTDPAKMASWDRYFFCQGEYPKPTGC
jgi:hypothetical protein